jgi:hypothetical protein
MQFSKEELEELCKDVCPACAQGIPLRQRTDTKEWVHDKIVEMNKAKTSHLVSHFLCLGHGLRKKYG